MPSTHLDPTSYAMHVIQLTHHSVTLKIIISTSSTGGVETMPYLDGKSYTTRSITGFDSKLIGVQI